MNCPVCNKILSPIIVSEHCKDFNCIHDDSTYKVSFKNKSENAEKSNILPDYLNKESYQIVDEHLQLENYAAHNVVMFRKDEIFSQYGIQNKNKKWIHPNARIKIDSKTSSRIDTILMLGNFNFDPVPEFPKVVRITISDEVEKATNDLIAGYWLAFQNLVIADKINASSYLIDILCEELDKSVKHGPSQLIDNLLCIFEKFDIEIISATYKKVGIKRLLYFGKNEKFKAMMDRCGDYLTGGIK